MHQRLAPKRYGLRHELFMFYLDLDELETLAHKHRWFSHNRWNLYSFYDEDHIPLDEMSTPERAREARSLKQKLLDYLATKGVHLETRCRVMLLTLPRILGYAFNPIAVYFCFDFAGTPACAIAEVGNTFGEKKLYLLRGQQLQDGKRFHMRTPKHYYVSPFSSLTLLFDFRLNLPATELDIRVDDYDGERKVLVSALGGHRVPLRDARLLWFAAKYPLLTLKVIGLIHWHALKLRLKGLPWHRKGDNRTLQCDVLSRRTDLTPTAQEPWVQP